MKIRALVVEAKDGPFELKELDLEEPARGTRPDRRVGGVSHRRDRARKATCRCRFLACWVTKDRARTRRRLAAIT
jgi:hypothetical protein